MPKLSMLSCNPSMMMTYYELSIAILLMIFSKFETSQVKRQIDLLNSQYDNFSMLDGETNDSMLTHFTQSLMVLFL